MSASSVAPATLDSKAIDDLKARHRGPLVRPGDPTYDEHRSVWNAMIDRKPALIARCLGVADVVTCVQFARQTGVRLAIKGGGHNIAGLAVCDGGLVLDMSLMRGVWVDRAARVAHAQAGCLLGDVDRETQVHGLASVLGFVSNTGTAGLTLGGGFGYLSRRFGWTSDNVRSMDVVTAEGQLVHASESENPDLFWGLRGGGGNFGVVTNFEYALFPLGPEMYGGALAWSGDLAPQVLETYRTFANAAPPELSCAMVLRLAPPAPWLPPEIHGKLVIVIAVCYTGPIADGEKLVAPLRAVAKPVGDIVMKRPYVTQQSLLDATQPKGRRYYWKSEYMSKLEPEMLAKVVEYGLQLVSPHSGIVLFPLGEAVGRHDAKHSAVGNRDARWVLNITSSWEKADDDAANVEWARAAWRDMRRFSTGGTYINFLTEEEGGDRIAAAYGGNLDRLTEIKTKWDPTNLFSANKNIAPRG
jgi:FAD/FMN-containing dehydrogenase